MNTKSGAKYDFGARTRIILLGALFGLMGLGTFGNAQTPLVGEIGHPTSTSLTVLNSTPPTYGQTVTFQAVVGAIGFTAPTGTVAFVDTTAGVTLGSVSLTTVGQNTSQAMFSTNALAVGLHIVAADFQGNSSYGASESTVFPVSVGKAATRFAYYELACCIVPEQLGSDVVIGAGINFPGQTPPSGTVLFEDTSRAITVGFAPVQSSPGNASVDFVTDSLNAGTYSVTATYQGDANYLPCTSSGALSFTLTQGTAAFTLTSSLNPSTVGQPVTFGASFNSGAAPEPSGSLSFKDGTNTLVSVAPFAPDSTTFTTSKLSAGTHSITVVYSGDSNYAASTSTVLTQTVNSAKTTATQTAVMSSLNPSIIGQPVTFTATVTGSGGMPTGTVTFKDGSTVIVSGVALTGGSAMYQDSSLTAATHSITAVYSGDSNYSGSTSAVLSEVVYSSNAATTTALVSSANPSTPGEAVTFTATVNTSGPGTPSGIVTFWDGTAELGSFALNGKSASLTTSSLALGTHSITAGYGGDIVFSSSTSAVLTQTVSAVAATSTAVASSANPSNFGQSVTFTATVSSSASGTPTGTVTFKDGTTTLGSVALSSAKASFTTSTLAAGPHSITAVYGGTSSFAGSTSSVLSQTVDAVSGATSVSLNSSANPSAVGQSVIFTAVVTSSSSGTPTGTVTFEDGTSTLGSEPLSGGRASFSTAALSAGTHPITAVYSGDSTFTGSTSSVLTQTVQNTSTGGSTGALAHFAAGDTWTTGIFVVNTGNQAAQFSIAFYDDSGNPVSLPFSSGGTNVLSGTIPANGSAYFEAADPQGNLVSGWGRITADPSLVIQALFRSDVSGMYYEAAVPSSSGGKEFLIPFDATMFAPMNTPFYTGFAVANLDSSTATVSCVARDSSGAVIPNAVPVPTLNPLGHWANYLFPALTGKRGTIDCSSNTNIAAIALRFIGGNAFSSLPVVVDPSTFNGGSNRALAHFAAGDVWTTGFFVLNTGAADAQFSIAFHDDFGNPVALPFSTGSSDILSGTIAAHGSAYYEAADPQGGLVSGSAQITAGPGLVVQALFRDDSNGTYYEAAVPSSSGSKEFLLPFDATTFAGNGQPFYTGFAIANLDQSPASVTCTARDSNGVVVPNAVVVPALNPLGHWANYLFPALTGLRGTIDCVSDTNVAATALRFIGGNAFSSLPVITK